MKVSRASTTPTASAVIAAKAQIKATPNIAAGMARAFPLAAAMAFARPISARA
jgi:hypothetical protein